ALRELEGEDADVGARDPPPAQAREEPRPARPHLDLFQLRFFEEPARLGGPFGVEVALDARAQRVYAGVGEADLFSAVRRCRRLLRCVGCHNWRPFVAYVVTARPSCTPASRG